MQTLTLVLVRHGFSLGNQNHLLSGWSDVPLTPEGCAELRQLRTTWIYPKTDLYFSSDLRRCRETFAVLYQGRAELDGILPDFREIYFGSLENHPVSESALNTFFRTWLSGGQTADEETLDAFRTRLLAALNALTEQCQRQKAQSVTLVTHSGVIRVLNLLLTGNPPETFPEISTPNGLGYTAALDIGEDGIKLRSWVPIRSAESPALSNSEVLAAGPQD